MKDVPDRIWLYEVPGQSSLRMSRAKPAGESAEYARVEGQAPQKAKPGPKPRAIVEARPQRKLISMNRMAKPAVVKSKVKA